MDQPATGRRTNPSDEVIHLGPLGGPFFGDQPLRRTAASRFRTDRARWRAPRGGAA